MAFLMEVAQLRERGVAVSTLQADNSEIIGDGTARDALNAIWSRKSYARMAEAIDRFQPDLLHVHNFFPILSPSIHASAKAKGIPVVQTLHNYRLICPNAQLMRNREPCDLCVGRRVKWPAVRYGCYRKSRRASAAVAAMTGVHHVLGTFQKDINQFIALTHSAANIFVAGGLPIDRIAVVPHAVNDPGARVDYKDRRGGLFVGRLSEEKGLDVVLRAWHEIEVPLTIMGDGPERPRLEAIAPPNVRFLGHQSQDAVSDAMRSAALLVFPSLWREPFGLTVVEAFSHGLTVLSAQGAVDDLVVPGVTGERAPPGDFAAWRDMATKLFSEPDRLNALGQGARAEYEARYTPDRVVARRLALYEQLLSA